MLFLESLSSAIKKNASREGHFYFDEGTQPDWAGPWLKGFSARLWAEGRRHRSLDEMATLLESPKSKPLQSALSHIGFRLKMAFLLEMAAMYPAIMPNPREGPPELQGILHFLLATGGSNLPPSWRPDDKPDTSKKVHSLISGDLAEQYLRLLAAWLWHAQGNTMGLPPDLPPDLGLESDAHGKLQAGYKKMRDTINHALERMRMPACNKYLNYWKGFNFGKERISLCFPEQWRPIENIFYGDKTVDHAWLKRYIGAAPGCFPTGDPSQVHYNIVPKEKRKLHFNGYGKYNISLLLILLLETLAMKLEKDPFAAGQASVSWTDEADPMDANRTRDVASNEEHHLNDFHIAYLNDLPAGSRASRFAQPEAARNAPSGLLGRLEAWNKRKEVPGRTHLKDGTPGSDGFWIWQGRPGTGQGFEFLERDTEVTIEEEDESFQLILPAGRTLAVRVPAKIWKKVPWGVISSVHWVAPDTGFPRYYIPHRPTPVPGQDGATIYLELDKYFLAAVGDRFPLAADTYVSVGLHAAHGLMHLMVVMT